MLQMVNLGRRVVGCTCRNPAKLIMFILWDLPQNGDIMTSMGCACICPEIGTYCAAEGLNSKKLKDLEI